MSGYLIDANVVSELTKAQPNPQARTFLTVQNDLWLSVIVIHELEYGAQTIRDAQHRAKVSTVYRTFIDHYAS